MTELGDIHEKINQIAKDAAYTKGQLKAVLPNLATKEHVRAEILAHDGDCRHRPQSAPATKRQVLKKPAGIAGAITLLAGAIYALVEVFSPAPLPAQQVDYQSPPSQSIPEKSSTE